MIKTATVVGAFWGDEGKGKFVDFMTRDLNADMAVRFSGGSNAGHTIWTDDGEKITFRTLPTGSIRPGTRSVLGAGMVIDPDILVEEIAMAKEINPDFDLVIDKRAHLVLDCHRHADEGNERLRTAQIGTTRSGIGPTYADKASRIGFRMEDLLRGIDEVTLGMEELSRGKHGLQKAIDKKRVLKWMEILRPYIGDGALEANRAVDTYKSVVFAGAQGAMLDIDYGTYPFVTSTSCLPSGVGSGAGVDPRKVNQVIGVVKAYTTRIGAGDFPTEIHDRAIADFIREEGNEYEHGVYIERDRRIGWIDPEALQLSAMVGNYDYLAVTMLDVIGKLDEIVIPGVGIMPGWEQDISDITDHQDLPISLMHYLFEIQRIANIPIGFISTGPRTDQVIDVRGVSLC